MGKFDLGGETFVLERGKKLPILPGDDAVFRRLLYKEKKKPAYYLWISFVGAILNFSLQYYKIQISPAILTETWLF
jgi:hypothetical protein